MHIFTISYKHVQQRKFDLTKILIDNFIHIHKAHTCLLHLNTYTDTCVSVHALYFSRFKYIQ